MSNERMLVAPKAGPGGFAIPGMSQRSPSAASNEPPPAALAALARERLLVIVRHPRPFDPAILVRACRAAGVHTLEISLNTPDALRLIAEACEASHRTGDPEMIVGAGTVMTPGEAAACTRAGARFLVSPSLSPEVASWCQAHGVPHIPGALTPSEIASAHASGAACVKVFPASTFGPSYLGAVKAPFPAVRLLAVGGVSAANAASWLTAGADAVAVGASTVKPEDIDRGNEDAIRIAVSAVVTAISSRRD